jgi:hypothetical protein
LRSHAAWPDPSLQSLALNRHFLLLPLVYSSDWPRRNAAFAERLPMLIEVSQQPLNRGKVPSTG